MRTRRSTTIKQLRTAIDCLPRGTKVAMLEGMRTNEIIVGAYVHDDGICPMLAAHRAGGRTDCISFAKAWDRFAFAHARKGRARRATERELAILRAHLEASLLAEEGPAPDLGAAIAEHRALIGQRNRPARPRAGDPDRSRELRKRPGWAWLRVMRRYDDYERALERIRGESTEATRPQAPHPSLR